MAWRNGRYRPSHRHSVDLPRMENTSKEAQVKLDLSVSLGPLRLQNPLLLASGTWGFGEGLSSYLDLSILGALVTKGISLHPRQGNPPPRIAETPCGLVNAIGLENPGLEIFKRDIWPRLACFKIPLLVNVFGQNVEEYLAVVEGLLETKIQGIEVNISCPNVKKGGLQFGQDPKTVSLLIKDIRDIWPRLLVVKLSPVGPVFEVAESALDAGADALTVANTYPALVVDVIRRKPDIAAGFGGLSGPAIKPLTLRLVREIYRRLKAPIIGCGGITSGQDVLAYILAGAKAVQIGTATLLDPMAPARILEEIENLLRQIHEYRLAQLTGELQD